MVPGPWGLFLSETTQFSFERIYPGRVNCVTWTPTGVYVCTAQALRRIRTRLCAPRRSRARGLPDTVVATDRVSGPPGVRQRYDRGPLSRRVGLTCRNIGACIDAGTPSPAASCTTDASYRDAAPTPSDATLREDAAMREKDADPSPTGCACRSPPHLAPHHHSAPRRTARHRSVAPHVAAAPPVLRLPPSPPPPSRSEGDGGRTSSTAPTSGTTHPASESGALGQGAAIGQRRFRGVRLLQTSTLRGAVTEAARPPQRTMRFDPRPA